jgi:hypothetical protein
MRASFLGAALLVVAAVLASAPPARAQEGGCPGRAPPASTESGATGPCTCPGYGTARDSSAYAYGRRDCPSESNRVPLTTDGLCTSPRGAYSGLLYSASVPFFAPGGEAYSYSGYGSSYSPYGASGGAELAASSASANGPPIPASPPACANPTSAPVAAAGGDTRLSRLDLGSLGLPSPTSIQRGADLREPNSWLIQTREGPIVERIQPDGRRSFTPAPQAAGNGATVWRPWGALDRPAVDHAWQSFAVWWTDRGRAWPPS